MERPPIRILIATPLIAPEIGGPATHVGFLQEHFAASAVHLCIVPFARVRHLPKIVRHLAYARLLVREGKSADVVYALDPVSVGLPAWIAARILRARFILRVPGDYAWEQGVQRAGVTDSLDEFAAHSGGSGFVRILKFVQTFVAKRAQCIVVPSEYLKGILTLWGVQPERIRVVYSAFTAPAFSSKAAVRRQLGFFGPTIISVGRLVPWKGFADVLTAVAALCDRVPGLQCIIAGDGPQRAELEAKATELAVSDRVIFTGVLPHGILLDYVRAADVCVLASRYEGFSHLLLEAAAAATPIIAARVGGNPELIEDGTSGRMIDYGDTDGLARTIADLLEHPSKAANLAKAAAHSLDRFEPSHIAALLETIFYGRSS